MTTLTHDDFTNEAANIILDGVKLAESFNSPVLNQFHLVSKLWASMEIPIKHSDIVTDAEFDALSTYWFDNLERRPTKPETKFVMDSTTQRITMEAGNIVKYLEVPKIEPIHIFYGIIKVDCKASLMLREYGFTPQNVLTKIV